MKVYELNMDGLVGPTHHYAGLATGNIAAMQNALRPANPAAAALQGLKKMRLLHQLGLKQAVIPPHCRPNIELLRQLGFTGTPAQILKNAQQKAPELLHASYSASSMWTANAATTAPSSDTADGRVHFTAANLMNHLHRHQEAPFSHQLLQTLFHDETYFMHHKPLPSTLLTRDEGAANHSRLCQTHAHQGIHLFVYNQQMLPAEKSTLIPTRFPARQTREASEALARCHQLDSHHVVFAQQNPVAVDQGVFHNDVISVGNESVFLVHEDAFLHQNSVIAELQSKMDNHLQIIQVKREQISLADAVQSYLFNSQIVTLPDQNMALIAPSECEQHTGIKRFIDELIAASDNPIQEVHYLDLKQSMRNGGGPACLRLRVVLNERELKAMHQAVVISEHLLNQLENWVKKHYRTELTHQDLSDPCLLTESYQAFDELAGILQLQSLYQHATV